MPGEIVSNNIKDMLFVVKLVYKYQDMTIMGTGWRRSVKMITEARVRIK